jgi:hypothetical protein
VAANSPRLSHIPPQLTTKTPHLARAFCQKPLQKRLSTTDKKFCDAEAENRSDFVLDR